jgi:hypothetical protein
MEDVYPMRQHILSIDRSAIAVRAQPGLLPSAAPRLLRRHARDQQIQDLPLAGAVS